MKHKKISSEDDLSDILKNVQLNSYFQNLYEEILNFLLVHPYYEALYIQFTSQFPYSVKRKKEGYILAMRHNVNLLKRSPNRLQYLQKLARAIQYDEINILNEMEKELRKNIEPYRRVIIDKAQCPTHDPAVLEAIRNLQFLLPIVRSKETLDKAQEIPGEEKYIQLFEKLKSGYKFDGIDVTRIYNTCIFQNNE